MRPGAITGVRSRRADGREHEVGHRRTWPRPQSLGRLSAGCHRVLDHGVLAPRAAWRAEVVPRGAPGATAERLQVLPSHPMQHVRRGVAPGVVDRRQGHRAFRGRSRADCVGASACGVRFAGSPSPPGRTAHASGGACPARLTWHTIAASGVGQDDRGTGPWVQRLQQPDVTVAIDESFTVGVRPSRCAVGRRARVPSPIGAHSLASPSGLGLRRPSRANASCARGPGPDNGCSVTLQTF